MYIVPEKVCVLVCNSRCMPISNCHRIGGMSLVFLFVYANLELPSYRRNVTSFLFPFKNPPYLLLFLWLFPVYLTSYLSNVSINLFIQLLCSFIIHSAKLLFLHIRILYLLPFLGAIFKFNRNYLQIFQHHKRFILFQF